MAYIDFEEFWKLTNFFYHNIGLVPYEHAKVPPRNLLRFVWTVQITLIIGFGVNSVYDANKLLHNGDILNTIVILSYVSFKINSAAKIYYTYWKRTQLRQLIEELNSEFPLEGRKQQSMSVGSYLQGYQRLGLGYASIFVLVIWLFNLYPLLEYGIFELWLQQRTVGKQLPYLLNMPWNFRQGFWYPLLYAGQCASGYLATCGQLGPDLMVGAITTQVLMHCAELRRQLNDYQVLGVCSKDVDFLKGIIRKHEQIYRLVDLMNEVFGLPIFVCFLTSAFIICFVGFQITIGGNMDLVVKLCFFLACSLLQVYLICWNSQALIDATEGIARAVYNHAWPEAHDSYRKMLVLIIGRAQKPAQLKGTHLLCISQNSVTELLRISYKFFAILRTMYDK